MEILNSRLHRLDSSRQKEKEEETEKKMKHITPEQEEFDFDDYILEIRKSQLNRQMKWIFFTGTVFGAAVNFAILWMIGWYYGL